MDRDRAPTLVKESESHGRLEIEQAGIDRASQGEHEGLKWEALMTMDPADGRGAGEVQ